MDTDSFTVSQTERALRYEREHARALRALAYRMLGSRAEAEDVVQDAWLRWAVIDEATVRHTGAYLSRLVTNLCLDKLGSAAARREQYVGVWLPAPLLDSDPINDWSPDPQARAEFAQDVSMAFMLALERLSPLERAVFLLRETFDMDFDEIGRHLDRSPAACRQLASRARAHVKTDYARHEVQEAEHSRLFAAFSDAVRSLDVERLTRILAEDAVMLADGGGKAAAVPRPLRGGARVAQTFIGFARMPGSRAWRLEPARVNGMPGCLVFNGETGELVQAMAFQPSPPPEPGRIAVLYIQRNPDKLKGMLAAWRRS